VKLSLRSRLLVVVLVVLDVAAIMFAVTNLNSLAGGNVMSGEWMSGMFQMIGDSIESNKNLHFQRASQLQDRAHFKRDRDVAFAREDSAIQRRIADARAAGVHPLYALGASGLSSPTFQMSPQTALRSTEDLGSSMGKMFDKQSAETHAAALRESKARAGLMEAQANDITQSQLKNSQAARGAQAANVQQDLIKLTPDQMASAQSRDPSVSAGRDHPAYREYTVTKWGLKMDLPYSEEGPSESLENVPFWMWPALVQHNRAKYGDDWGTRFMQEFVFGKAPQYVPESSRRKPRSSGYSSGW